MWPDQRRGNEWTGLRQSAIQLAPDKMHRAVTLREPSACWPGLFREEPGVCDIISVLVTTKVRLATVASSDCWIPALARMTDRVSSHLRENRLEGRNWDYELASSPSVPFLLTEDFIGEVPG